MNFDFADEINDYLTDLDFRKAIEIGENHLRKLSTSSYHSILGLSLLNQVESLMEWIDRFYVFASKKRKIQAMYFEMTEFDINTKEWRISGFAFEADGGLDLEDMDWLCDFDEETTSKKDFLITGYEELQVAFGGKKSKEKDIIDSRDWCEQLILARFMELMREAHKEANKRDLEWANIPIYFTEHSYDFTVKSEN